MKVTKYLVVLAIAFFAIVSLSNAQTVAFLGGGSSALFVELGQAAATYEAGIGTPCIWTQGKSANILARDNRTSTPTDEEGNIWVVWNAGTGSCASPAGTYNIYSYMSLDSVLGDRCYFEVDSSGTAGCVQIMTIAAGTAGASKLCYPTSSSCGSFGDTAGGIPASVISALNNQHWFVAGTDIRPEDAKFATYRMLQPCGTSIWRQPFDQALRQVYGLGYQTSTSGVGTPVQSYYSSSTFHVLDFNITGNDPINTSATVPSYTVSTVGAQPIVVAVSPAGGTGIGAATDAPSWVLMLYYMGVLGRATDLIGPTTAAPITTLVREPLSGTYNVFEYSEVNNNQFHGSQDDFNCPANGGPSVYSNPMNLQATNGQILAYRRRVIGTSEMVAQIQAGTSSDQRLGYFFWSAGNASAFTTANGKYLTVNGVDPLTSGYTDGVFPGVDSNHPLSNVTFKYLNQGDYPIWSALRLVSKSPTPAGVTNLIAAAQTLNSTQYDFIPLSNLKVWHSHYYLPILGLGTAANGAGIAGTNDLCATTGAYGELGGDAGGSNILKQANADFCADFGSVTGLILGTN
jgi:hypothetical protein